MTKAINESKIPKNIECLQQQRKYHENIQKIIERQKHEFQTFLRQNGLLVIEQRPHLQGNIITSPATYNSDLKDDPNDGNGFFSMESKNNQNKSIDVKLQVKNSYSVADTSDLEQDLKNDTYKSDSIDSMPQPKDASPMADIATEDLGDDEFFSLVGELNNGAMLQVINTNPATDASDLEDLSEENEFFSLVSDQNDPIQQDFSDENELISSVSEFKLDEDTTLEVTLVNINDDTDDEESYVEYLSLQ